MRKVSMRRCAFFCATVLCFLVILINAAHAAIVPSTMGLIPPVTGSGNRADLTLTVIPWTNNNDSDTSYAELGSTISVNYDTVSYNLEITNLYLTGTDVLFDLDGNYVNPNIRNIVITLDPSSPNPVFQINPVDGSFTSVPITTRIQGEMWNYNQSSLTYDFLQNMDEIETVDFGGTMEIVGDVSNGIFRLVNTTGVLPPLEFPFLTSTLELTGTLYLNCQTAVPGSNTAGVFRSSTKIFYMRNTNSSGQADVSFSYGNSTDTPLRGDWNGDTMDTAGVFRSSNRTFYLRNNNSGGAADVSATFGSSGDVPVIGDWDGDGDDTIGVYRSSNRTFYLRNSNSGGGADVSVTFGGTGDTPIIGDWDGDGDDTIGVYRSSNRTFYLRNSNTGGAADVSVTYGGSGDTPHVGDWDGDGDDTIGTYRASNRTFYMRNSNSGGVSDYAFSYGSSGDTPLTGDWDSR